jgi:7-keto-8-aminopelargonate synthetase-like enzyme
MGSHSRLLDAVEKIVATGSSLGIGLLQAEDEQLDGRHLQIRGQSVLSFSSCSYLGLELDPRLIEATVDAVRRYGTQFSASRTYVSAPAYEELEALLEEIFGGPVLTAPSTTLAHLTTLPVLVGERDAVILDQKVHESVQAAASLLPAQGTHIELVRHSRVDLIESRVRHLASRYERIWYCCDGVYSMQGDFAPISELRELLDAHEQLHLYADDAHGTSWSGPRGCGTVLSRLGSRDRVFVAVSLNKSFAAAGGAVVFPSAALRDRVRARGGPTRYSGPIQPPMLGAALGSARIHLSDALPGLQQELWERMRLRNRLAAELKVPLVSNDQTPLGYIGLGPVRVVSRMMQYLLAEGVYANAGTYPAVPANACGIRFTVTRHHTPEDVCHLLELVGELLPRVLSEEGVSLQQIARPFLPRKARGATNERLRAASWRCQHETAVHRIGASEWDRLMTGTICFDSVGLASLEAVFAWGRRPEDRWNFHYYVVRDEDGAPVVAAHFTEALWKDDMLAPAEVSASVEKLRLADPYHQTTRVLAAGTLLSEGDHVYLDRSRNWRRGLAILLDRLSEESERRGAGTVVLRDLPSCDAELDREFEAAGFSRIELAEEMNLEIDWEDQEEFLSRLSYSARRFQKRMVLPFDENFDVEVLGPETRTASRLELQRLRELYENVKERSLALNTFGLPESFLPRILESAGWEVLALSLRSDSSSEDRLPIGFVASYRHGAQYVPRVIGLDYHFVRSHGLYRQCIRHVVRRAEALGYTRVLLGIGAKYEKSRFGARPERRAVYLQAAEQLQRRTEMSPPSAT